MKISADYYEFLLEIGVRYEGEVEGVGEVYCELVTIASSTADNGFRRGGATFLSTAYVPMVIPYGDNAEPPTDRYTYMGGNMQDKNSYIHRDRIDDGKNDIEVSMPEWVVEAKAPKMKVFRGVAIGGSLNFDFQFVGSLNTTPISFVHILKGQDAGKTFFLQSGAVKGIGAPGGSVTGSLDVYDYYGTSLNNLSIRNFIKNSRVAGISVGELIIMGNTYGFSKFDDGTLLMSTSINLGIGGGLPISGYKAEDKYTKKIDMTK